MISMSLRFAAILSTCAVIGACTAVPESNPIPLNDVELLDEVVLPEIISPNETATASLALAATPEEAGAGFLGQLFSARSATETTPTVTRTGPDAQVIPFGESVEYGKIATVCDVPDGRLGTIVANVSGYQIYDTIPNATTLRPHFIMGFDDGCARQFSSALSLTGDVGTHEIVRYLPANRNRPYSTTDNAYEAIKAGFCRVGHGKSCGARIDEFAKNTTFVTAYEKFGAHPRWVEILLHDGEVQAIDFKAH
jgi:hypothetical protein